MAMLAHLVLHNDSETNVLFHIPCPTQGNDRGVFTESNYDRMVKAASFKANMHAFVWPHV